MLSLERRQRDRPIPSEPIVWTDREKTVMPLAQQSAGEEERDRAVEAGSGNPAWAAGWVVSWRMERLNWDQRGGHEPAERRTKMGAGVGNARMSKLHVVVVCMVLLLTAPQTACDTSSSFCGLSCCPPLHSPATNLISL